MNFDPGIERAQTVAFGVGMLSLGFWYGTRVTGQLAYREQMEPAVGDIAIMEQPDWIATVKSINQVVLVVFAVCMILVVATDYYGRDEEERPTLESIGLR